MTICAEIPKNSFWSRPRGEMQWFSLFPAFATGARPVPTTRHATTTASVVATRHRDRHLDSNLRSIIHSALVRARADVLYRSVNPWCVRLADRRHHARYAGSPSTNLMATPTWSLAHEASRPLHAGAF